MQLIAEYNSSGSLVNRYIPGARLDEILIKIAGATTTFFHMDRLGSTIAQTDDSGVVLNKYKYSAFGETPSLTGTIFGFTGQRFDSEIGQYNYKARYYAPGIGRFLQPDPLGYAGGDMNLYAYIGNDVVNFVDPHGGERITPLHAQLIKSGITANVHQPPSFTKLGENRIFNWTEFLMVNTGAPTDLSMTIISAHNTDGIGLRAAGDRYIDPSLVAAEMTTPLNMLKACDSLHTAQWYSKTYHKGVIGLDQKDVHPATTGPYPIVGSPAQAVLYVDGAEKGRWTLPLKDSDFRQADSFCRRR